MQNKSEFKIVLIGPEIPGNTGSIGRTCVALNLELILIEPIAFDLSQKAVRRAGLDYWQHVKIKIYQSFDQFIFQEQPNPQNLFFFSRWSKKNYHEAGFIKNCYLVFGSESKGINEEITDKFNHRFFKIPMKSDIIRSLNLANAATAVALEAQRQIEFEHVRY